MIEMNEEGEGKIWISDIIYPGTFDPITKGHLDIIERAEKLFPNNDILVAVAESPSKKTLFSLDERVDLVRKSTAHLENVFVVGFSGAFADFVKRHRTAGIIRGVRTTMDFEYELQLAQLNRTLADGVDTVFLPTKEQFSCISSSIVRELFLHDGDVSPFVPQPVLDAFSKKAKNK